MRDESLAQLLLLGEPEAVVAAVGSPGLTDELARRAWWAMEDAGNARRMLANARVRDGRMGPILAEYLLQYLPFETDPEAMMESVRLILQPGYLKTVARILDKPPNQDVLLAVLDCLRATFAPVRPEGDPDLGLDALSRDAEDFPSADPRGFELMRVCPDCRAELQAMRFLSGVGYALIRPLLSDPTTQGTLMRRKLAPVLDALLNRIDGLTR